MNLDFRQQVLIALGALFSVSYIRAFIDRLLFYQRSINAFITRSKGQTFKEWLLYSRFKEDLPKIILKLYYVILIINSVCLIAWIFVYIIGLPINFRKVLMFFVLGFNIIWIGILEIIFWKPREDRKFKEYAFERYFKKIRKGNRKRKKKY